MLQSCAESGTLYSRLSRLFESDSYDQAGLRLSENTFLEIVVVVNDRFAIGTEYFGGMRRCDAYRVGSTSLTCFHAIDGIFHDVAVLGLKAEGTGRIFVAIGERFRARRIFSGEHTVEMAIEVGVVTLEIFHLLMVGTGHNCRTPTFRTKGTDEIECSADERIGHLFFKTIEVLHDPFTCFASLRIVTRENLSERAPLDFVGELWVFGKITMTYGGPETGVLRFAVDNHAVKVEKECCGHRDR